VANQVNIVINAQDKASQALGRISDKAKSMRGSFLKMGAAGGAIVGVLGVLTKSALDQEIGINKLDSALKNVNTSYAEQEQVIEKTLRALQDKTNFGDEEQREALTGLIRLTGDYETSLSALPVVMDLAVGANMDFKAASTLMAKALSGETSSLSRYGIKIDSTATKTEILAILTKQFGGAAEAAFDPLEAMKNELGDMGQQIGDVLLPMIMDFLKELIPTIKGIVEWTDKNPALTKTLVLVTGGIGALLISLGILGLALPPIITAIGIMTGAWTALTVAMWANPLMGSILIIITAVVFAIGAIVTAIVLLHNNWSKVVTSMKKGFNLLVDPINAMISAFNKFSKFNVEALEKFEFTGAVTRQTWSSLEDTLSTTNGTLGETGEVVGGVADETDLLTKATKELGKITTKTVEKMSQEWGDYYIELDGVTALQVERNAYWKKMRLSMARDEQDELTNIVSEGMDERSKLEKMIAQLKVGELDRMMEYYRNHAKREVVIRVDTNGELMKVMAEYHQGAKKATEEFYDTQSKIANALPDAIADALGLIHEQIGMDEDVLPGAGKGLPTLGTGGRGYTLPAGGLFNVDRTKQLTQAGLAMWEAWGTKDREGKRLGMHAGQLYQDEFAGKYFQNVIVSQDLAGVINVQQVGKTIAEKRGDATTFSGTEEYNL
jgi:hypothetical protein